MSEVTRVDYYGETVIDIGQSKQDILYALEAQGVNVPQECLLCDVAALISAISHNVVRAEVDGAEYLLFQPEEADGCIEQRFNE